jgi:hypothetical protein
VNEENQRLKTENERLWKIAEKTTPSTNPVIIQQSPIDNSAADRRAMQMMLLRSLLVPRSTVNVNMYDCTKYPANCVGR